MNYYRFPEKKPLKAVFFLYLLVLQLLARSTMYTSTFVGAVPAQLATIGLVALAGVVFLIYNRRHLKQILTDRRMIAFGAAALLILGPMVIRQDWQMMYFTILVCIFFPILLSYFLTLQEASRYYVWVMVLLSVWTVVGQFILKPLANLGVIPGFPFDSPGGWHMLNFGLTFAVNRNTEMNDALRVFSIFREPGLYQIFLFIAIQLNNYHVSWDREWKMWAVNALFFFCMLLTFATGGVLALALYIVFLFFDKGLYRDKRMRILAAVLVIAVVAALTVAILMDGSWAMELVWMIQKIFEGTDSVTTRVDAIFSNAEFFLASPIFGSDMSEVLYAVPNNTATSPILFAVFGIAGGCAHVLSWAALAWKKERHWLLNVLLMVILFVPFNTQNVFHDMFFWLFPVLAAVEKGLQRRPGKKG